MTKTAIFDISDSETEIEDRTSGEKVNVDLLAENFAWKGAGGVQDFRD